MHIMNVGEHIEINNTQFVVIDAVIDESGWKNLYLASDDKNKGILVVYKVRDLSEKISICKKLNILRENHSEYVLCKPFDEYVGFWVKGYESLLKKDMVFADYEWNSLCSSIVSEFKLIHEKGIAFGRFLDYSDLFAMDFRNKRAICISPEHLINYGERIVESGDWTCGLLAPELVMSAELASIYTDRYSMAVILFETIFCVDPMIGKQVRRDREFMPQMISKSWWAEDRLFIFDEDDCNRCFDDQIIAQWDTLNNDLKNLFIKVFSRKTEGDQRPNENAWMRAFKESSSENAKNKKMLPIVFIVANPKSMEGIKIKVLNQTIEEFVPEIRDTVDSNTDVEIRMFIMTISDNAKWEVFNENISQGFSYKYIDTAEGESVEIYKAIEMLRVDFIEKFNNDHNIYCPIIFWFLDSTVNSNYDTIIQIVNRYNLYKNSLIYGVAIGEDADKKFLNCIAPTQLTGATSEFIKRCITIKDLSEFCKEEIDFVKVSYPEEVILPILKYLGNTGRAKTYLCTYKGKPVVYKEYYNPIIPMKELWEESKRKIESGNMPGEWPIAISKYENDKFGYICEMKTINCKERVFSSTKARILACKNVIKIYKILHDNGYCFQHNSRIQFDIDYTTGYVELNNVDEILTYGKHYGIGRNSLETAPELYWNNIAANIEGDRYSLSVLLFELLFDAHPFEGKKAFGIMYTDEVIKELYVNKPIYIWDFTDNSNRPLKHQYNGLKAPAYIMDAFSYSFSNDVVKGLNGKKRVTEKQWFLLFKEWWDEGGR